MFHVLFRHVGGFSLLQTKYLNVYVYGNINLVKFYWIDARVNLTAPVAAALLFGFFVLEGFASCEFQIFVGSLTPRAGSVFLFTI